MVHTKVRAKKKKGKNKRKKMKEKRGKTIKIARLKTCKRQFKQKEKEDLDKKPKKGHSTCCEPH